MKTFLLLGIGLSALSPLFAFAVAPGTHPQDDPVALGRPISSAG